MDCALCLTKSSNKLWVLLSNGTRVCVNRMGDVGARILEIVSDLEVCEDVKPTSSYTGAWIAIGLGGVFGIGLIGALVYKKIKIRREQSRVNAIVDQLPLHPINNAPRDLEAAVELPEDDYVDLAANEEVEDLMDFEVELQINPLENGPEPGHAVDLEAAADQNDQMILPAVPVPEPAHPLADLLHDPDQVPPVQPRKSSRIPKPVRRLVDEM